MKPRFCSAIDLGGLGLEEQDGRALQIQSGRWRASALQFMITEVIFAGPAPTLQSSDPGGQIKSECEKGRSSSLSAADCTDGGAARRVSVLQRLRSCGKGTHQRMSNLEHVNAA